MSCGLDICYCQSNSIIYNILYCFNTSHVTLYRKYSCQNSRRRWVSIHLMLLFIFFCILFLLSPSWFQYISCYSLSSASFHINLESSCFNTSHVTLYRCKGPRKCPGSLVSIHLMLLFIYSRWSLMRTKWRFNTSHVTLYHHPFLQDLWLLRVSIHLMLLFISGMVVFRKVWREFQYISCYSLSYMAMAGWKPQQSFNTSHVTLYRKSCCLSDARG